MKALLESTGLSVKNISDRLHYDDSSHMCKVFRRHTGMSPIQYRNRNKMQVGDQSAAKLRLDDRI